MKNLLYLILGIVFGLALTKGEAVSWFRMQEMFRFESFHMYGIFMTAVPVAALSLILLRKTNAKTVDGEPIVVPPKPFHPGLIIGGLIFGFGWALTGACPGPIYAQLGAGFTVVVIVFLSAVLGTYIFGLTQRFLP